MPILGRHGLNRTIDDQRASPSVFGDEDVRDGRARVPGSVLRGAHAPIVAERVRNRPSRAEIELLRGRAKAPIFRITAQPGTGGTPALRPRVSIRQAG